MPILEEMKNIVVLFADSLRIFDLVSNRMCSFEKSLEMVINDLTA